MSRIFILLALALTAFAADPLQPLDIRRVKVSGEIGRRIDVTIHNNLLVLDAGKDFLAPLDTKDPAGGYIGLGKLLMSAVRFAAYSGDPKVIALKDRLVARILASQSPDGYTGFFSPPRRVTVLWDIHETGYLIAGLTDNYTLFHHQPSLDAAVKAANYLLTHWNQLPPDWGRRTGVAAHVAVTGLERTMLHLHQATGNPRFLQFVTATRALPQWDLPVIVGRRDGIEGHIYAFMARSLAQLELYRLQPDPRLLRQSSRALDFFTRSDGMAVTGGAGQWEIWTDDQDGRGQLAETCATAYQLRVLDSLLRLHADPRMGDLMERTIHNTLFAAQSPDGRRIRYYSPFEGPREYHPGDTYCCPGNYRRIVSELPEMIYYRTPRGLAVNLYTASQASIALSGPLSGDLAGVNLNVRQVTTYPSSGAVTIEIEPSRSASFELQLRIPAWAKGATLSVNGQAAAAPQPGSFATLTRLWKPGDRVQLDLPMSFRLVRGRQQQAGRVAVLRGPLVFSLNPSADPALASLDAADLSRFTLDPASLELSTDDSLHPGGLACLAGAWKPGYATLPKHDLRLRLTEFADPAARATYFRLRDLSPAVPDELLAPPQRR